MVSRVLTTLLCSWQLCVAMEGINNEVSLVQSLLRVHNASNASETVAAVRGRFLVDNSHLKHSGPGVFLRKSKQLDDVLGFDQFLAWGTIFEGTAAGEGWVQYENYFVPTSVKGVQIMTLQNIVVDKDGTSQPVQHHPNKVYRFHYAPTNVKLPDGATAKCRILRQGSKPQTYNVEVFPESFSSYNMTDVPIASLERVRRIREFTPFVKPPAPAPVAPVEESIHFTVKDSAGEEEMALKVFKKSPMRTVFKMACDRFGIPWFKCQKKVKFLWKAKELSPDAFSHELKMEDGEVITMVKP